MAISMLLAILSEPRSLAHYAARNFTIRNTCERLSAFPPKHDATLSMLIVRLPADEATIVLGLASIMHALSYRLHIFVGMYYTHAKLAFVLHPVARILRAPTALLIVLTSMIARLGLGLPLWRLWSIEAYADIAPAGEWTLLAYHGSDSVGAGPLRHSIPLREPFIVEHIADWIRQRHTEGTTPRPIGNGALYRGYRE